MSELVKELSKNPYTTGEGVGCFIVHDEHILYMRRQGAHGEGTWAPPGGKRDVGETLETAAIRESLEETGLHIHGITPLGQTDDHFEADGLHFTTHWFAAKSETNAAEIREAHKCSELLWLPFPQRPENLFLSTAHALSDKKIFNNLFRYIWKVGSR